MGLLLPLLLPNQPATNQHDESSTVTHHFFRGQRRAIAHNIIDGDSHGKGHATIDRLPIDLFRKQFGRLGVDDGRTEFTNVNDFGPRQALTDNAGQGGIDNLSRLLVFRANIAVSRIRRRKKRALLGANHGGRALLPTMQASPSIENEDNRQSDEPG
jgi:hypothetical protein